MRLQMKLVTNGVILLATLSLLTACKKTEAPNNATPVEVMIAQPQLVNVQFKSTGSIVSLINPKVKAEVPGNVVAIKVQQGQVIKEGEILAEINSTQAQLAYRQAEASVAAAQADYKEKKLVELSNAKLVAKGIVSKVNFAATVAARETSEAKLASTNEQFRNAKLQLSKQHIKAPVTGSVESVAISQGDSVTVNETLFTLVDQSKLQIELPFSETQVSQFAIGQSVVLQSAAVPDAIYIGKVTAITPAINPQNRSFNVIVNIVGGDTSALTPGASITGNVYLTQKEIAVLLPIPSVVLTAQGDVIYTVSNNKAVAHAATIKQESDTTAIVIADIHPGDLVVSLGAQYLYDGAAVSIKNAAAIDKEKAEAVQDMG